MAALGVGIVGAGFAAELHAVNYRPLVPSRVALAAVWSRTRTKAEAFAREGVDYLFLGKSGAILLGCPGTTLDLDLFMPKARENAEPCI